MFFPLAVAAVIMIVFVVMWLVAREKSSARRQRIRAAGYFATQDARFAGFGSDEQAQRDQELSRV